MDLLHSFPQPLYNAHRVIQLSTLLFCRIAATFACCGFLVGLFCLHISPAFLVVALVGVIAASMEISFVIAMKLPSQDVQCVLASRAGNDIVKENAENEGEDTGDAPQPIHTFLDAEFAKFGFSPQEALIAAQVLQGDTYKAIAKKLYFAEPTVKYHTQHLYAKAGVRTRREFTVLMTQSIEASGKVTLAPHPSPEPADSNPTT